MCKGAATGANWERLYKLVQAMSALEVSVRYRFLKIISTTDAPHDKRTAPDCYLDGLRRQRFLERCCS